MAMCFRDRQFCSAACSNTECSRNLNEEVYAAARRWWGDMPGEAPISMADMSKNCSGYQPATEPADELVG